MAGIPCINDTCGITSTVDGSGRLNLNVRLDADGGIVCTDGEGLGVNVLGSTGIAEGSICESLLGLTTTNKLFARQPNHELFGAGSERADLATGATVTRSVNITNDSLTCPRLIVFDAVWKFVYTVTSAGAALNQRYYSNDVTFDLLVAGTSILAGDAFSETLSGVGNDSLSDQRSYGTGRSAVYTLGAGATVQISMRAIRGALHTGTGAAMDGTGDPNGVTMGFRAAVLELPSGNLATPSGGTLT